ncbi:PAS domain S-box protein [Telmatospirillum sp. J64-1]|uniref:sensor domain-containing protein n=1 Tax=Telmatospirillum sp. J64-1 TaxID=2502183 RepID=UPI00163D6F00|nr:PAS domain S-box protein [Telmatospirillum sp. J64-1]
MHGFAEQWSPYLVELVPDLVCVCVEGEIIFVNSAGASLLGFAAPAALKGRSLADFVRPDFLELFRSNLDILSEEDGEILPLVLVRQDGRPVEVELSARLLTMGYGGVAVLIHGRDVTDRNRAAEILQRNEERYRRLVDMALDFTCIVSGGAVSFINAAGLRLLDASSPDQVIGLAFAELAHPDYRALLREGLDALVDERDPMPVKFLSLTGKVVDAEIAVLPFGGPDEQVYMIEARDISERKRAAEALQEREQRLQGIMDSVAEGIITADERGVIQSLNPAAEALFGWKASELVGQNLSVLMPSRQAQAHDGYIAHYLKTGEAKVLGHSREMEGRRRDGSVFALDLNVTELRQGEARLFIGIVRDVTERKRTEEALRRARDELEARVEERTAELRRLSHQTTQILNSAGEGIVGIDRDGNVTFANPRVAELSGFSPGELVGRSLSDLLIRTVGQEDDLDVLPLGMAISLGLVEQNTEMEFRRKDGTSFPIEIASAPMEDGGVLLGSVMMVRDITERKQAEEKSRLAATVFETTAEAIMVLDSDFRVTMVNPAYTVITGYQAAEVTGARPFFLVTGEEGEDFYVEMWRAVREEGRWEGEQWNRRKDGARYAERLAISVIRDEHGQPSQHVVVFSDITQRKLDEERIRYQANYDGLTGLPNRTLFLDRLGQAVASARRSHQRVGLMFIDLDGFKLVNDTLGHDIGDELLKEAARRLQDCVRSGDTVARLGGDEFTVIMPDLGGVQNASLVAGRIIAALEKPMILNGHEAFVSASIGLTTFPEDAQDPHALLKNADAAMYRAKEQGKANYQFFTADMNAQVKERLVIKNGLSKALERDEFVLFYQPKVELGSNRIVGVEALLRWRNADLGLVSPVKFIPILEESGLIGPVGEWVLDAACRQHKAWSEAGFEIPVAVNLSVRQLRQPGFARVVEDLLNRADVRPWGLELEITESMIMKDTENAVSTLRELHNMGINLAMDDFGTGYSSLSYLKRFPLDVIKIDRSFVNDIATDPDDLEIIRTIISMGHSLRRRIIAEGVETVEQRQLLEALNCDEIQGYLISRPVPAEELTRMLQAQASAEAALEVG